MADPASIPPSAQASTSLDLGDDGVIRLVWGKGATIDTVTAERAFDAVDTLAAGSRYPLLVDMSACEAPTRGARAVFARHGASSMVALLGRSPVDRVVANFWLGLTTPPVPTRFFTIEAEAVGWLLAGPGA